MKAIQKKELFGTVQFMRSFEDSSCGCPGSKHVFCRYIRFDGAGAENGISYDDFLKNVISSHFLKNEYEGKPIRITIEVLE